jgi:transcriptional regulator with XRE-family HTH domain
MGHAGSNVRTLGADLRSLRKSRKLTLEDLAGQLGKSVGWLSQVERDLSTPDPEDLTQMAQIFDVPQSLFSGPAAPVAEVGRVVRKTKRRAIGERVPGLVEDLLSPDLTDSFEVVQSTFLPGAGLIEPVRRDTQELAVMITGKLDIWLGDQAFTVTAGDSFRVRDETLRWANPYDAPAVAVWVISPPVY